VNQDAAHESPQGVLVVGRHHLPRSPRSRGGGRRFLVGCSALSPAAPLGPVSGRGFPVLGRAVQAFEESPLLHLLGDVEKELDDPGAVAVEVALERVDVLVAVPPNVLRGLFSCAGIPVRPELGVHPDHRYVLVAAAVEDPDPAPFGKHLAAAPQEVVGEPLGGGLLESHHRATLWVHPRRDVLDRPILAGASMGWRTTSRVEPSSITVALFDGFELLDVFGPLEMFGRLPDRFRISLAGPTAGVVTSAQGPQVIADTSHVDAPPCDLVLVPGGIGTLRLVENGEFLAWLADWASSARYVTSVCTGSGVLAAAGLLDGFRATSNKRAFEWACAQGPNVNWIAEARWIEDRQRWTSSGVAAGIDMALALIGHLHGNEVASEMANAVEYDWHRDSSWDPFAAMNGLAAR